MKPVKIKIDPNNRKAHVDSIFEYLEDCGYRVRSNDLVLDKLGFYCDNVVAMFGSEIGYITYTLNEQAYDLSKSEEIFIAAIDKQWNPQNGETIECRHEDNFNWTKCTFIGMYKNLYITYLEPIGLMAYNQARPSAIQQEIDQLEARLAELKAKL